MQLPPEDRDRVRALLESVSRHVAMAAFIPNRSAKPTDIIASGTVSFVESPERLLLLTNAHVWNGFLDEKARTPDAELILIGSGEPVAITNATPLAIDPNRDLAVLACDQPDDIRTIGKVFYRPKAWPILPPEAGEEVLFVGFPGMHRSAAGNALSVVASLLAPTVVGVGGRSLRLEFTNPDKYVEQFKAGLKPFGPLGGVSGSALYRLIPGTNTFDLTGCVYGAGDDLAFVMAARLDCLNPDGTLTP